MIIIIIIHYHYHYYWYGTITIIMNMLFFSTIKNCHILWPWACTALCVHLQPWARFGGGLLSFILFWTLSFATWPPCWRTMGRGMWIVLQPFFLVWLRGLYTRTICMHPQIHLNDSFFRPNSKYFRCGIVWGDEGWAARLPHGQCQGYGPYLLKAACDRKAPGGKRGKKCKSWRRIGINIVQHIINWVKQNFPWSIQKEFLGMVGVIKVASFLTHT